LNLELGTLSLSWGSGRASPRRFWREEAIWSWDAKERIGKVSRDQTLLGQGNPWIGDAISSPSSCHVCRPLASSSKAIGHLSADALDLQLVRAGGRRRLTLAFLNRHADIQCQYRRNGYAKVKLREFCRRFLRLLTRFRLAQDAF